MLGNDRIQRANHCFEVVNPRFIGKGRYFSRNRIPNQIRMLEYFGGADLNGRNEHQIPRWRQLESGQLFTHALAERGLAEYKDRYVGAKLKRKRLQPRAPPVEFP